MRRKALKVAFPHTLPILTGFAFLGLAYGIYMNTSGFPFYYPMLMSMLIFGGSLEFVAVEMLLSSFAPLQVFIMALLIQARHLFYGLSMLEKYKGMGWKKFFLIFGMCDETFSINYTAEAPEGVDKGWFLFFITLLDYLSWTMFVVIFLDQWLKEKSHVSSIIGLSVSALCLICFGPDSFMIPTMLIILGLLTLLRPRLERQQEDTLI